MAKTTAKTSNHLPDFFSVSRAIQYGDGLMTAVMPNGSIEPIQIREFAVRGAKSSHGDAYAIARGDAKVIKDINTPNPQVVDGAFLPIESDRLRLEFSMNILPVTTDAMACNDFDYTGKLRGFISAFATADGFKKIAELLAWRLASGAFLWRNRYGIDKKVTVFGEGNEWTFDADTVDTRSPAGFVAPADLVDRIAAPLSGKAQVLMLTVRAEVTVGFGQEVFPSQEMEMKGSSDKSKLLYAVPYRGVKTAAMHPQKVGAAVRAYDIWHPEYANAGPLSIEPLGYSHQHQQSFRTVQSGTDLYGYLMKIEEVTEKLHQGGLDEEDPSPLFLMGCLMRGGVFSMSKSDDKKAKKAESAETTSEAASLLD